VCVCACAHPYFLNHVTHTSSHAQSERPPLYIVEAVLGFPARLCPVRKVHVTLLFAGGVKSLEGKLGHEKLLLLALFLFLNSCVFMIVNFKNHNNKD